MTIARTTLLALLAGLLLSACGGGDPKGPPGSASNPLVALPNPSATRVPPTERPPGESSPKAAARSAASSESTGSAAAGATATRHGSRASRPCSLVTKAQAEAIVGARILQPLQAPQGPTCIYQTTTGKPYITLAVQTGGFARLRKQIHDTRALSIAGRTAYCGTYGQPMLFLPVGGRRVLSIAAPCGMARQFAAKASAHL